MTLQEAIVARHSVRQYTDKPIEADLHVLFFVVLQAIRTSYSMITIMSN